LELDGFTGKKCEVDHLGGLREFLLKNGNPGDKKCMDEGKVSTGKETQKNE